MNTVKLHHELTGDPGRPVLMLASSLGTSLSMWDAQTPALSPHFRLLRVDTRGHGRSPVPPGPYTIAGLGQDFLMLLDDLGLERVSFCGLSLGAMIGMWLAAHAPQRIGRLALCCTSAHLPPAQGWTDRAATVRSQGMTAVADAVVSRWFTPAFPQTAVYKRLLENTPAEGYAGCCEAVAAMDLRPVLDRIVAPTLLVSGVDDPATPPPHQEFIASAIHGARLARVPGAHLANIESASHVTTALLDHFTHGGK
ncbi:MAG TPA: 3-oxoadipate enol-lactonase [Micromonosporaceae bacterium]|nr:3-oxoadipate enol-lactonase [Micromonosporaceae bacterium]HCU50545.1 3-oxoadipate enol-lactonase [Micromonosporaceae bacterium]